LDSPAAFESPYPLFFLLFLLFVVFVFLDQLGVSADISTYIDDDYLTATFWGRMYARWRGQLWNDRMYRLAETLLRPSTTTTITTTTTTINKQARLYIS
jgi:hypothetical protein